MSKPISPLCTPAEIRAARIKFDLSQKEAGQILGVDETTIQRWESGETKKIRRAQLDRLVDEGRKRAAKKAGA
jgi:DNA-binding transcriptional regulator YiaG